MARVSGVASVLVRHGGNSDRSAIGIYHAIDQSKTARRGRSLKRGAQAWAAEVRYRGGARRGAVLLTLTFREHLDDRTVAYHLRRFWDAYTKHFDYRPQRLSWLEYQASGRHHYHAIIIDPPPAAQHRWEVVASLWGQGRTNMLWRNAEWVDHTALRYAVSYSKKFGEKAYQQEYEQASRAIRTYHTSRLHSADARLQRLPRWAYHAATESGRTLLDGVRAPGGGLRVEASETTPEGPQASQAYRLSIEHQINWHERAWWPPGAIVVRLGAVRWEPCASLTG